MPAPARPGTGTRGMTKLASPVLVTEKLPGVLPAATVRAASAAFAGATVARVGCCGTQAISPRGGGGGSTAHVQPPGKTAHARTHTSRRNPRSPTATSESHFDRLPNERPTHGTQRVEGFPPHCFVTLLVCAARRDPSRFSVRKTVHEPGPHEDALACCPLFARTLACRTPTSPSPRSKRRRTLGQLPVPERGPSPAAPIGSPPSDRSAACRTCTLP